MSYEERETMRNQEKKIKCYSRRKRESEKRKSESDKQKNLLSRKSKGKRDSENAIEKQNVRK